MIFSKNLPRNTTESSSLLRKVVAFVVTAILIVLGLMFSVLLFAVIMTAGVVAWGYLWWRSRDLRKQMYKHPTGGLVIEGEVIRDVAPGDGADR